MHLRTSSHVLSLNDDAVYELRKATGNADDWLSTRKGEAYGRKLHVVPDGPDHNRVRVFFEDTDCGIMELPSQRAELATFVRWWNDKAGPTDLVTAKIAELVSSVGRESFPITVRATTWNCGGSLGPLVEKLVGSEDIQVLAFQETDRLDRNVSASTQTLHVASDTLKKVLPEHELVSSVQLLGLMTLVFVRRGLTATHVETDTSSTGFLKVWGNKGAVLTRLRVCADEVLGGGLIFQIMNCHLSAGEGGSQMSRRRWELDQIGKKFGIPLIEEESSDSSVSETSGEQIYEDSSEPPSFGASRSPKPPPTSQSQSKPPNEAGSSLNTDSPSSMTTSTTAPDDTLILLLGDLNYRLLLEDDAARTLVGNKDFSELLTHDSLALERSKGVLTNFVEAPITFAPTYKYETGSAARYADRVPSYTDRVLFWTGLQLEKIMYESLPVAGSDHLPVAWSSHVGASRVDLGERSSAIARALRLVDSAENRIRPRVTLDPPMVEFEGTPLSAITRHVLLKSGGGQKPFNWTAKSADPNLIQVNPTNGVLHPADPNGDIELILQLRMPPSREATTHIVELFIDGGQQTYLAIRFIPSMSVLGNPQPSLEVIDKLATWLRPQVGSNPKVWSSEPNLDLASELLSHLDSGSELPKPSTEPKPKEAQLLSAGVWLLLEILKLLSVPLLQPNRQSEVPALAHPVLTVARQALDNGTPEIPVLDAVAGALYDGPEPRAYIKSAILME